MMLFRAVKQTDAARLAELRRPGAAPEVQRALSAAAIAQELDSLTPVYPCLVAEIDGQVEACAFAAPLRPESAYQWDVELHIFVSEERRRQGQGKANRIYLKEFTQKSDYRNSRSPGIGRK